MRLPHSDSVIMLAVVLLGIFVAGVISLVWSIGGLIWRAFH